jgi:hypothetical protein
VTGETFKEVSQNAILADDPALYLWTIQKFSFELVVRNIPEQAGRKLRSMKKGIYLSNTSCICLRLGSEYLPCCKRGGHDRFERQLRTGSVRCGCIPDDYVYDKMKRRTLRENISKLVPDPTQEFDSHLFACGRT